MNSSKYVLLVEYDGTRYHGFQWQLGLPTIQDELERAMKKFCGWSSRIMAASRTDAGVHAKGQVVSLWANPGLSPSTMVRALNHYLPTDIAIKAARRVESNFNVRRDASSREYHYHILNGDTRTPFSHKFTLFMPGRLNIEAMNEACQLIKGEHDFTSFISSLDDRGTVRHVHEAEISKEKDLVIFRIIANSFLHHQVRNTIGLLLQLGSGKINVKGFQDIMEAKVLGLAGPRAPAHGLCLTRVNYPDSPSGCDPFASAAGYNKEDRSSHDQSWLYEEFR